MFLLGYLLTCGDILIANPFTLTISLSCLFYSEPSSLFQAPLFLWCNGWFWPTKKKHHPLQHLLPRNDTFYRLRSCPIGRHLYCINIDYVNLSKAFDFFLWLSMVTMSHLVRVLSGYTTTARRARREESCLFHFRRKGCCSTLEQASAPSQEKQRVTVGIKMVSQRRHYRENCATGKPGIYDKL